MKLSQVKIDKSDSKSISENARNNEVQIYDVKDKSYDEYLQLLRLMDTYVKHRADIYNP